MGYNGIPDRTIIEAESAWEDRDLHKTLYGMLSSTTQKFPNHNAITY